MVAPTLDQKLSRIRAGRYRRTDFMIADAKDADMGFGLTAPGPNGAAGFKSREQYLNAMTEMTRSGLVDIMLMSLGSGLFPTMAEARSAMAEALGRVRIVEPDDDWKESYDRLYRNIYSRLAPTLAPIHDALAAFRTEAREHP